MLIISLTNGTFSPNHAITIGLFKQVGNTLVRVICNPQYYGEPDDLEDSVCIYMNSFMPKDIEIKTSHARISQSTGVDAKGIYVNSLDFQVYI